MTRNKMTGMFVSSTPWCLSSPAEVVITYMTRNGKYKILRLNVDVENVLHVTGVLANLRAKFKAYAQTLANAL